MKIDLTYKEKRQLRQKLDYGDIKRIAKMTGYSRFTVSRFFYWQNSNYLVLVAVLQVIDEKEELLTKLKDVVR